SFIKISPTVGRISPNTIQTNIKSVLFAPHADVPCPHQGVSFLVDETAMEKAVVYMSNSNHVGGLCWLHSHNIDTTLNTYQAALNIANALKNDRVHLAREIMVVGAHFFGEDHVYPLLTG
ncbi:hypothetical protein PAXRUDRAFT_157198, partial [Paxillus rubicundulus Ve08.2h10]